MVTNYVATSIELLIMLAHVVTFDRNLSFDLEQNLIEYYVIKDKAMKLLSSQNKHNAEYIKER